MASTAQEIVNNDVCENNSQESASPEDNDKPKKMSARYNLFRYKSKDISDMTYNGELFFLVSQHNVHLLMDICSPWCS